MRVRVPVSSNTSRATASSNASPTSTKPASAVCSRGGWRRERASSSDPRSALCTATMIAGSCRGKVSPPQPLPHLRAWPACTRAAAPPQLAQKAERRCQASRPWAYSANALSVPSSLAAASRVSANSTVAGPLPLVTPPSSVALAPASTAKTGRGSSGASGASEPATTPLLPPARYESCPR